MNVNSLSDKSASLGLPARGTPDRPSATAAGAPVTLLDSSPAASVEVRLSPVTQSMTHNVARSATDAFNAEKVQAMRSAIQNGSFSANAEAIADRMLGQAREMLGVAASSPPRSETPSAPPR